MQPKEIEAIHRDHIKQKAKERNLILLTQLSIFVVFVGVWEWLARINAINVLIFSYPSKMWELFWAQLLDGRLLPHIGMTVWETVVGFLLGTLLGTLLATLIWWSPFLSRVLDPYLVVLNSMPKVALGPVFIVFLGPGLLSIIAMGCAISVIITTIVIYTSFKEVNQNYVKVVQTLGGNKRQIFRMVILPSTIPAILSTLKVNVGLSWVGVIVGEFLVSKMGLGYLIIYGFQVFNFTLVMVALAIIAVVATLMYQGVALLERRLTSQFK
ncbi:MULTISPECIES: ABC transporter permease [Brevibacillus]|jgi:NitT/TauT family transport system permease protein|uniref:ABC transporter permease n=1 Tax=Brevibacillus borstelensis AK1 TaxID=1300222 RepID=M8DJN6_9BACL|nr:ABC transporter permease subunit [Brevibacillus borstelensis]EMT53818.1 ABC transporter permease [Brevibacillus borstelensis AK1]KKX56780.1 ABC transporter permease [Brevibacillus borstelensis cifa_chp40]MBE5395744.1 ABC transporter permease [Brevibacillus borstelensis]MCC0566332.1 ABC transporter permease [Brevibacillus borstelensis]MCM3473426.1 ABC transporter permease [Brevibacillus borstelensis]